MERTDSAEFAPDYEDELEQRRRVLAVESSIRHAVADLVAHKQKPWWRRLASRQVRETIRELDVLQRVEARERAALAHIRSSLLQADPVQVRLNEILSAPLN